MAAERETSAEATEVPLIEWQRPDFFIPDPFPVCHETRSCAERGASASVLCLDGSCGLLCRECDAFKHSQPQRSNHVRAPFREYEKDLELFDEVDNRRFDLQDFVRDNEKNALARMNVTTLEFEVGPVYLESREAEPEAGIHVVGFTGPTGGGKSYIAAFLCDMEAGRYPLQASDDTSFCARSTSSDIHLYRTRRMDPPDRPNWGATFLLDCEGVGGSRDTTSQQTLFEDTEGIVDDPAVLRQRMEEFYSKKAQYREEAYPPMVYVSSDVLVYVCTHKPQEMQTLLARLLKEAVASRAKIKNVLIKPCLVLVFNDQTRKTWPTVDEDTAGFLASEESQRLLKFYTRIRVVALPSKSKKGLFVRQMRRLKATIRNCLLTMDAIRKQTPGQSMFATVSTWFTVFALMVKKSHDDPFATLDLYNLSFQLTPMSDDIADNVFRFFQHYGRRLATHESPDLSVAVARHIRAIAPTDHYSPESMKVLLHRGRYLQAAQQTQERLIAALLLDGCRNHRTLLRSDMIPEWWMSVITDVRARVYEQAPCLARTDAVGGAALGHTELCGLVRASHGEGEEAMHRTLEMEKRKLFNPLQKAKVSVDWMGDFDNGHGEYEFMDQFIDTTVARLKAILRGLIEGTDADDDEGGRRGWVTSPTRRDSLTGEVTPDGRRSSPTREQVFVLDVIHCRDIFRGYRLPPLSLSVTPVKMPEFMGEGHSSGAVALSEPRHGVGLADFDDLPSFVSAPVRTERFLGLDASEIDHEMCFGCLLARPTRVVLCCNYLLCTECVEEILICGTGSCPLCSHETFESKDLSHVPPGAGFRVLALDGGGMKGIVEAAILERIEEDTGFKIIELFDLIVGTSTGGIIALGIASKRSPREMKLMYREQAKQIFQKTLFGTICSWMGMLAQTMYLEKLAGTLYGREGIERALRDTLGTGRMVSIDPAGPKVCVTAVEMATKEIVLFGNYTRAGQRETQKLPTLIFQVGIAEAGMATAAAPTYLPLVELGGHLYTDGGMQANNPASIAYDEAHALWEERGHSFDLLVSLGTGIPTDDRQPPGGASGWIQFMRMLLTSTEGPELVVREKCKGKYYRLDADGGVGDMGLDETDAARLLDMEQQAARYIDRNAEMFSRMCHRLMALVFYAEIPTDDFVNFRVVPRTPLPPSFVERCRRKEITVDISVKGASLKRRQVALVDEKDGSISYVISKFAVDVVEGPTFMLDVFMKFSDVAKCSISGCPRVLTSPATAVVVDSVPASAGLAGDPSPPRRGSPGRNESPSRLEQAGRSSSSRRSPSRKFLDATTANGRDLGDSF